MADSHWYLSFAWGRAPYALDLPEVVIGRGDGAMLQIDEPAARDEHARFIVDDEGRVWLEDVASGQPTLVNGRALSGRTALSEGDFVQIGHSVLTLRHGAPPVVKFTSGPDERTATPSELPDSVRRAVSERDAKNFVVGQHASEDAPLATVMMESPLAVRREQQTIEANAEELMAAIRKNQPVITAEQPAVTVQMSAVHEPDHPAVTVQMDAVREPDHPGATVQMTAVHEPEAEAQVTVIAPPPPRPVPTPMNRPTLHGVGPEPLPSNQMPTLADHQLIDDPRLGVAQTMMGAAIPVREVVVAAPKPQPADFEDEALGSGPTQIAKPAERPRDRRSTQNDATPLPAPLPAKPSVSDLGPLVAQATQQRAAVTDDDEDESLTREEIPLHAAQTMLPTPLPGVDPRPTSNSARMVVQPTDRVKPIDANAPQAKPQPAAPVGDAPLDELPYTPPTKGMFGSFSRAVDFFQQMFELTKRQKVLLKPMINDLVIATGVSVVLSLLLIVVHSGGAMWGIMSLGTAALYFIDYYCNATTAALIYDYATRGSADMASAKTRVKKSLSGIMTFAAVSAVLDVGTTYARERNDLVAKILLRIAHAIWTTATYVIMPAMIIEGISFKDAFARSKKLMDRDPTGVGAGIVALSLCSYIIGAITFSLAFTFMRIGSLVHPALGMLLFFSMVNLYWALSGWIKISYSTCFYLWAQRCEAAGRPDSELAPLPLRHALAAG